MAVGPGRLGICLQRASLSQLLFWLPLALPRWARKKKVGSLVKPCISEMSKLSRGFIPPLLALQHQVAPSQLPVTSALLPIPNQDEILQDSIW